MVSVSSHSVHTAIACKTTIHSISIPNLNLISIGKCAKDDMEKRTLCLLMNRMHRMISMKNCFNYQFICRVEYFAVSEDISK